MLRRKIEQGQRMESNRSADNLSRVDTSVLPGSWHFPTVLDKEGGEPCGYMEGVLWAKRASGASLLGMCWFCEKSRKGRVAEVAWAMAESSSCLIMTRRKLCSLLHGPVYSTAVLWVDPCPPKQDRSSPNPPIPQNVTILGIGLLWMLVVKMQSHRSRTGP